MELLYQTYICVCVVASIVLKQQHHHWTDTQEERCDKVNRQTPAGSAAAGSARELQYGCGDCKPGYIENIKGGCILSKIIYTCRPVIYCKTTGGKC